MPIQKAAKLKAGRWILVYDKRNFDNANNVFTCLQKSSINLGIIVEEPVWFELESFNHSDVFERQLREYCKKSGEPSIVMLMLAQERQYKLYKNICYNQNVISQVIASKTVRKMNLSVASNVLK